MFSPCQKYVVLIKKARPEYLAGKWNGVGGKVEKHESESLAMAREFQEETGVMTEPSLWEKFANLQNQDYTVNFFRMTSKLYQTVGSMTDEWVSVYHINSLPEATVTNVRWLIPMALDKDLQTPVLVQDTSIWNRRQNA